MTAPIYALEAGQILRFPIACDSSLNGSTVTGAVMRVTHSSGESYEWAATVHAATATLVTVQCITDGTEIAGIYRWRAWLEDDAVEYPTTDKGQFTIAAARVSRS